MRNLNSLPKLIDGPPIAEQRMPANGSHPGKQRRSDTALFLRPVPLAWLLAAADLPGKALQVGLAIWFYSGLRPGRDVVFSHAMLARFRVPRETGRRALAALEQAGLVTVIRRPPKAPRVRPVRP
jgi:hypothetical protein